MKQKVLLAGTVGACLALLTAHAWAEEARETLTNAKVIELHKLDLGDAVIIEKIKVSDCKFDTSVEGLKQLKEAGLSGAVIKEMIAAGGPKAPSDGPGPIDPAKVNDPTARHPPGIWLYLETEGQKKMTKLEPSVISKMKTGSGIGMGFGKSMKTRAILSGLQAAFRITERKPTFYFYFEETESGLSHAEGAATSPNEFILAQFDIEKDDQERRLIVGRMNAYSGFESGPDEKSVRAFDFEKMGPGIYKVVPKNELKSGEYCFFYAGQGQLAGFGVVGRTGGKMYDFGIE